jgi:ribosomal protein S18 acetylase RimI-like enzyme
MIRPATKQDCKAMLELIKELALYEKAPDEVTVTLEHFIESGFGVSPIWWGYVCEVDTKIVGMALCYTRFSTWKGQRCYLEDLIVSETYRAHGYGKILMDAVIKDAQEKNMNGVVWQVLDWNLPAIEFYKKYQANFDAEWVNCSINFKD